LPCVRVEVVPNINKLSHNHNVVIILLMCEVGSELFCRPSIRSTTNFDHTFHFESERVRARNDVCLLIFSRC
jgi:hypothetical protein